MRESTKQTAIEVNGETFLTGACDHCSMDLHGKGHAELTKVYNDHLRGEHPGQWVKQ